MRLVVFYFGMLVLFVFLLANGDFSSIIAYALAMGAIASLIALDRWRNPGVYKRKTV